MGADLVGGAAAASLSARRAWIEIVRRAVQGCVCVVALRKESVDRNFIAPLALKVALSSLSARRAWIEIRTRRRPSTSNPSLSARRAWIEIQKLLKKY